MCPFVRDTPGMNALQQSAAAAYQRCPTRYGATRIGLITPFDRTGNASATRMFEDMGFEVVSSVGFSCADALHIPLRCRSLLI